MCCTGNNHARPPSSLFFSRDSGWRKELEGIFLDLSGSGHHHPADKKLSKGDGNEFDDRIETHVRSGAFLRPGRCCPAPEGAIGGVCAQERGRGSRDTEREREARGGYRKWKGGCYCSGVGGLGVFRFLGLGNVCRMNTQEAPSEKLHVGEMYFHRRRRGKGVAGAEESIPGTARNTRRCSSTWQDGMGGSFRSLSSAKRGSSEAEKGGAVEVTWEMV